MHRLELSQPAEERWYGFQRDGRARRRQSEDDEDQQLTNRPIEPSTAISELDVTPTAMIANTP